MFNLMTLFSKSSFFVECRGMTYYLELTYKALLSFTYISQLHKHFHCRACIVGRDVSKGNAFFEVADD
jgi:hypothetical protein